MGNRIDLIFCLISCGPHFDLIIGHTVNLLYQFPLYCSAHCVLPFISYLLLQQPMRWDEQKWRQRRKGGVTATRERLEHTHTKHNESKKETKTQTASPPTQRPKVVLQQWQRSLHRRNEYTINITVRQWSSQAFCAIKWQLQIISHFLPMSQEESKVQICVWSYWRSRKPAKPKIFLLLLFWTLSCKFPNTTAMPWWWSRPESFRIGH